MGIIWVGLLVAILVIIFTVIDFKSFNKKDPKNFNKDWSKRSILSKRLENEFKNKVTLSKRYRVEQIVRRAGYNFDYWTLMVYRIGFSIAGILFGIFVVQNLPLGITLGFVGFLLPLEIIKLIANNRMAKLEDQVGLVMRMLSKRYETTGDMPQALRDTLDDIEGQEPIHEEMERVSAEIGMGVTPIEALESASDRIGNKFFERFVIFYTIASDAGTDETKRKLLEQAVKQYEDNKMVKLEQIKQLREPIFALKIFTALIPFAFIAGAFAVEGFVDFYLHNQIGKIAISVVMAILLWIISFINAKVSAPLDESIKERR